jgi:hypothetical protein
MMVGKRAFFQDKRSVHVKIENQDLHSLRTYLISKNLTMQDIFEEFAQLVVTKDRRALSILESLCRKKIENFMKLDKEDKVERKDKKKYYLSELETDALYNLINEDSNDESDDSLQTEKETNEDT